MASVFTKEGRLDQVALQISPLLVYLGVDVFSYPLDDFQATCWDPV